MRNFAVVLAVFEDEAAADSAAETVWQSKLADDGANGILALDANGEVKTEKVGKRSTVKGAGIGLTLALLTPVGMGVGLVGGGLLGALHHKGLGLDEDDQDRLGADLVDGNAAVGVLAQVGIADTVLAKLTDLGGTAKSHPLYHEDLEEAGAALASDAD